MFATTFVRDNNCFTLTVDNSFLEATIAWLRKRRVVFVLTVGVYTAVFTMKYLRSYLRDRLNLRFNTPATQSPAVTRGLTAEEGESAARLTASLLTPTFTRRSDGTYVLVVDVKCGVDTHKWLDALGCKCDRIVGRKETRFVFWVITGG